MGKRVWVRVGKGGQKQTPDIVRKSSRIIVDAVGKRVGRCRRI
jgi:hypothetical protein